MEITRRGFMKGVGAAGFIAMAPNLVACGDDGKPLLQDPKVFIHGVASGDPLADRVIIWTRVTSPEERAQGGRTQGLLDVGTIEVAWEVSENPEFTEIIRGDIVETDASRDYTVKVDVTGLEAGTTYYYRFMAFDEISNAGRTRTAPTGSVENLRFAVASCASLAHGFFNAYRALAHRDDLDAVVHLGDYIYEYGTDRYGRVRPYDPPHEIVTLEDYRRRHGQYKTDHDLQAVHHQHPFICVWDDHEVADNTWKDGAKNHNPEDGEGDYDDRRTAAHQAYSEWMPIRDQDDISRIFRSFSYGSLVDLIMLDTRSWGRDLQGQLQSEERSMLGADQEAWLHEQLQGSTAKWKILGQQVMVGQFSLDRGSNSLNGDGWDGYVHARERLFDEIEETPGGNVVVLTGDIHTAFALDLVRNPFDAELYDRETGDGSVSVEFVCTSITSPGLPALAEFPALIQSLYEVSPHLKFADFVYKGYTLLDVTPERIHADYVAIDGIEEPTAAQTQVLQSFVVRDGAPTLVAVDAPMDERPGQPSLVPTR